MAQYLVIRIKIKLTIKWYWLLLWAFIILVQIIDYDYCKLSSLFISLNLFMIMIFILELRFYKIWAPARRWGNWKPVTTDMAAPWENPAMTILIVQLINRLECSKTDWRVYHEQFQILNTGTPGNINKYRAKTKNNKFNLLNFLQK